MFVKINLTRGQVFVGIHEIYEICATFFRFALVFVLLWRPCHIHAVGTKHVGTKSSTKDHSGSQSRTAKHRASTSKSSAQMAAPQHTVRNDSVWANISDQRQPSNLLQPLIPVSSAPVPAPAPVENAYVRRQRQIDAALEGSWVYQADPPLRFRPQVGQMNVEDWLTKNNCSESSSFPGQSYVWKPLNQPFRNYTRATFCRLMRGRHLILIGDSMNDQLFLTLYQMMWPWEDGLSIEEFYHKWGKGKDRTMFDNIAEMAKILIGGNEHNVPGFYVPCPEGGPSNNHFRLSFIRNYYLGLNRKDASDEPKWEMIKPFVPYIEAHRGAVLVLNRGAHYRPDREYVGGLASTFDYLRRKHRDALVIYRDTPHGHLDIQVYQRSVPLSPAASELLKKTQKSNPKYQRYKYEAFPSQNRLAQKLIAEKFPEVLFMNVSHSTNLRWDSHADPIHYCIPGPIDHWVQKLIDVLLVADAYPDLLPEGMRGKISPP